MIQSGISVLDFFLLAQDNDQTTDTQSQSHSISTAATNHNLSLPPRHQATSSPS